jgi:hypothetical protein
MKARFSCVGIRRICSMRSEALIGQIYPFKRPAQAAFSGLRPL